MRRLLGSLIVSMALTVLILVLIAGMHMFFLLSHQLFGEHGSVVAASVMLTIVLWALTYFDYW